LPMAFSKAWPAASSAVPVSLYGRGVRPAFGCGLIWPAASPAALISFYA
jgi:hypothetical protein